MIKKFLIILTFLLFFKGCGEKKIEHTFKDNENYKLSVEINNDYYTIRQFDNNNSYVIHGDEEYYIFDTKLYKDKHKKKKINENLPKDFYKIKQFFEQKFKIIEKGEDLINKENYNFIKFETNKINDLTSIFNIKTKGKVTGYLYTNSNDEIYKIIIKNDEINIKIYYSSFGNIKNYYSKLDDLVVEDEEHDKKIDVEKNSHNK